MAVEKISISIEKSLARRIRQLAKREKLSMSAITARALEHEDKLAGMRQLIEEYEAEHGVITQEEMDRTREILWPD